mgnify:CR=1 FL=1
MNDTEYRESCRKIEKNIHTLEAEINALNDECERLWDLKEKGRNNLQMSSLGNKPVVVEKTQGDMAKESPIMDTPQDRKAEDKSEISQDKKDKKAEDTSEISQDKKTQINQFCPYCGAEVRGMRFCGQCGKRVN